MGGNCTRTQGPLSITVTVGGQLLGQTPIRRDQAIVDDRICVSGPLGRSALAIDVPTAENHALRHQWRPHFKESAELVSSGLCTAMMDISDGLIVDARRMAHASQCAFHLDTTQLRKTAYLSMNPTAGLRRALYGGEDYVLLFTMKGTSPLPPFARQIGTVQSGHGVFLDGQLISTTGFDHFETPKVVHEC